MVGFIKNILVLNLLFASIFSKAQVNVCAGKVIRHQNFSSKYVDARNIDIWLPKNYESSKKYAVIYMHDGQMLFDSSTTWNKQEWGVDETLTHLLNSGKIKECIVVGIWNSGKNRHIDFFPQMPFESLTKEQQDTIYHAKRMNGNEVFSGKIQSDNYLQFLVEELKPFVDKTYHTQKSYKNTFIMGSSMGGLISIYAICRYPKVFGGAACLSTHWPGIFTNQNNAFPYAMQQFLINHLPNWKTHKIYFDFGTETLDSMYEPYQMAVDKIIKRRGFNAKQWETKKFVGAAHSEKAWKERLFIPIEFLLGN